MPPRGPVVAYWPASPSGGRERISSEPPFALSGSRGLASASAAAKGSGGPDLSPRPEQKKRQAAHIGRRAAAGADEPADGDVLRALWPYLWPERHTEFKLRIAASMAFLVGAKVLNVQVPYLYKHAVDALAAVGPAGLDAPDLAAAAAAAAGGWTPTALLVAYGVARAGSALCGELRNAVFAKARDSTSLKRGSLFVQTLSRLQ